MGSDSREAVTAAVAIRSFAATRRQAVVAIVKATTAIGLVLADGAAGGSRVAAAKPTTGDLEVLVQLFAVERTAFFFYRDGLTQFISDETTSGDRLLPNQQPTLARIWHHERRHLALLSGVTAELGISTALGPQPDFTFVDFAAFLRRAAELKHQHVADYVSAVTALEEVKLRSLVAQILAVEARHAAYLNERIGAEPFSTEREGQRPAANPLLEPTQIAGS